jgi:hypothetical protein
MSLLRFKVSQQAEGPRRIGLVVEMLHGRYCVVRYYQPENMLVELRGTGETISYEELLRRFEG